MNLIALGFLCCGLAFFVVLGWLIWLTDTVELLRQRDHQRRKDRIHGR